MKDRVTRLLIALREIEASGLRLERDALLDLLAQKTNYPLATIKTYLTKNLGGVLLHEQPGTGKWYAKHAVAIDEDQFGLLMGQNNLLKEAAQNRTRWLEVQRAVAELGKLMGFEP